MHNRPDMDGLRPVAVAVRRSMRTSSVADVFVADEKTTHISHVPMEPHLTTKPGWEYPVTHLPEEKAWTMRRYVMLVKHDPDRSRIADYLVVRDEILSPEPVGWNLHVLARSTDGDGPTFRFPGLLDVDLTAHFLTPAITDFEKREWGWRGKSGARRNLKGADYERECFGAYIPEDFERGTWGNRGEMAKWLRVKGNAGQSTWLVILMPNLQGQPVHRVERISDTSARITMGDETETVHLGGEGMFQAAVEQGHDRTGLLGGGPSNRKKTLNPGRRRMDNDSDRPGTEVFGRGHS